MRQQQLLGQTARLLAEHKKNLVGIGYIRVTAAGLGGKEINRRTGVTVKKILKAVVVVYVQLVPVIQPRALHALVVNGKPQRMNEVERSTRGGAGAGNIARVLGNLRLVKNDVNVRHGVPPSNRKAMASLYPIVPFFSSVS